MEESSPGSVPWRTLKTERIYENPWFALRQDQISTHTGAEITYTYVEHPGAVAIVPITPDGDIVLIRQYRHTVRDWCWEIPMGRRDDDHAEQTARRELFEEIGGTAQTLTHINFYYPDNGITNTRCDVYLARGVELGQSCPEPTELIEIVIKPKDEVLRMAQRGEITDGMSALAILLSNPYW